MVLNEKRFTRLAETFPRSGLDRLAEKGFIKVRKDQTKTPLVTEKGLRAIRQRQRMKRRDNLSFILGKR